MKVDKFLQRITECLQINTSNTNMLNNDLDYSGGNSTPQFRYGADEENFSFEKPLDVFADNDYMYNDKYVVNDTEIQEYNSKENAANNAPILKD